MLVVVVRIVGADLRGLVDRAVQHGRERVGVLDEGLEGGSGQTAQVAEALGAVERAVGRTRADDGLARTLECVTELFPRSSAQQAFRGGFVGQDGPLC